MKKFFTYLGCLATALFISVSAHAVPVCLTNVTVTVHGTISYDPVFNGLFTMTQQGGYKTYSGVGLASDCSGQGCIGAMLTLTPTEWQDPMAPPFACADDAQHIGVLTWQCSEACDPSHTTYVVDITFPAHASSVSFYVCVNPDPNAKCSLYLGCVTPSAPCNRPPQSCQWDAEISGFLVAGN